MEKSCLVLLLVCFVCPPGFSQESVDEKRVDVGPVLQEIAEQDSNDREIRKQVVKVFSSLRSLNLSSPWRRGEIKETTGSGVWLGDGKILTNAHVVLYSSQIYVQPFDSSDRISANVVAVSPEMDLAILELEDATAFEGLKPMDLLEELPKLRSEVQAYGYPTGGDSISVTEGVVSRIEYTAYHYGESGLRIQVDAALNPGNSGGPAIVDGQIAGLVSSHLRTGDNIGYLIPSEEIATFFNDVEDGSYEGKPKVRDVVQNLQNSALRQRFGLTNDQNGVVVTKPFQASETYPLKVDDVITHVGPYDIDNEGMVRLENGLRLGFPYFVPKLMVDGEYPATIVRGGETIKLLVPAGPEPAKVIQALKGDYPEYFVYGPLVFSEAVSEYETGLKRMITSTDLQQRLAAYGMLSSMTSNESPLFFRKNDVPAFEGEQLIMFPVGLLPHRISKGYDGPYANVLAKINGTKIENLKHMVQVLRDMKEDQVKFEFAEKDAPYLVFNRKEIVEAMDDILVDNAIAKQGSTELLREWNKQDDD